LEDDARRPLLDVTGGLDHGTPSAVAQVAAAMEAEGVAHEWLGGEAAAERWPGMRSTEPSCSNPTPADAEQPRP